MKAKKKVLKSRTTKAKNSKSSNELTERQRHIVLLTSNGHSLRQIAFVLDVVVNTVRHHLQKSLNKLGLNDKKELTKSVIDQLNIK